ncbi:hypothetical protein N6H18_13725 [Reichenbachiella agarivorans]|uniref:Lipocalin-like domain-containing protein n=1 Tax=Reichenbachiella agarivorans TaxID=2979464 RepID=A0ABY6CT16_9BACT|nr:hypothetical protein [Reichenbachiella agarivorans]UXP31410.1 hypothetical protein N6H18_13725 [Reichenbachiella agarivorans]
MKNVMNKILLLGLIAVLFACSEDEKKPDPIIGTWILDDAIYSDAPAGYSFQEGTFQTLYGETEYSIRFYEDLTFERELKGLTFSNGSGVEDEGTYELDDEFLTLDPDSDIGLDTDFDLVEAVTERDLKISTSASFNALPDATLDTITSQASYDSISAKYSQAITLKITMNFDKE